jgi:hypothetical protein
VGEPAGRVKRGFSAATGCSARSALAFEREHQATGEREYPMGMTPTGNILFFADGRMAVVLAAEGRKAPATDRDRAGLLSSLVAYTGTYRSIGWRGPRFERTKWGTASSTEGDRTTRRSAAGRQGRGRPRKSEG